MAHHNWEHYHLDKDKENDKEFNADAYVFYDFEDHEIEQMERDRLASLEKSNDSASKPDQTSPSSLSPEPEPALTSKPSSNPKVLSPQIQGAKERVDAYRHDPASIYTKTTTDKLVKSFLDKKKYRFIPK